MEAKPSLSRTGERKSKKSSSSSNSTEHQSHSHSQLQPQAPSQQSQFSAPPDEPKSLTDEPRRERKSKGTAPSRSNKPAPQSPPPTTTTITAADASGDYDDEDFEDYGDDDFEDEEVVVPVKKEVVKKESKSSRASPPITSKPFIPPPTKGKFTRALPPGGSKYAIQSGQNHQQQQQSRTQMSFNPHTKRINNIKSQITLSCTTFTAYERLPVTAYSLYLTKLRSNTTSSGSGNDNESMRPKLMEASQQFNENSRSIAIETDGFSSVDKECQVVDGEDDTAFENMLACVISDDLKGLRELVGGSGGGDGEESSMNGDFNKFLESASRVTESLCEENSTRALNRRSKITIKSPVRDRDGPFEAKSKWIDFGVDMPKVLTDEIAKRKCLEVVCSSTKGTLVMIVHPSSSSFASKSKTLSTKSIITLYETFTPSTPKTILLTNGIITSATLGSSSSFVIAGLDSGGIALWDLREPSGRHIGDLSKLLNLNNTPLRFPSYTTNFMSFGSNPFAHTSAVVSVGMEDMQVTSIDDRGMMCVWFVFGNATNGRGKDKDEMSNDQSDLGLGISSSIKLMQSRSTWLGRNALSDVVEDAVFQNNMQIGPAVTGMWFFPSDNNDSNANANAGGNHLIFAKSNGNLYTCERFSGSIKMYTRELESGATSGISRVISCSMSKFLPGVFIISRDDGSVELYRRDIETVIFRWGNECWEREGKGGGSEINVKAEWSSHRPSVFYVNVNGWLFIMDIMADDASPAIKGCALTDSSSSSSEASFGVTRGSRSIGKILLVCAEKGRVSAKVLSDDFCVEKQTLADDDELEWMETWIGSVVS